MKAESTFAIDFITRIKSDRKNAAIFARITVNGDRKEISLKENIIAKEWDSKSEMVKGKSIEAKSINGHIDDVRFRIKEKYRALEKNNVEITAQLLKDFYVTNEIEKKKEHTIIELVQFHSKVNTDKLKQGTLKNYTATEEYLKRFIRQKFDKEDAILSKVDFEFITELEYYIRNNPLKEYDPCKGNGVMKHLAIQKNDQVGKKAPLD